MPPPASSPGSVEPNRSAPATSARYSGLMPRRSRASSTRPLSRSTSAKENIPMNRSTQRSPQAACALVMTSVSLVEKNRKPSRSSSARSSSWL